MSVVAVLIFFSVCVAAGFLAAFLWAVRSGQYADRHTPAIRMLFDDQPPQPPHHTRGPRRDRQSGTEPPRVR